MKHSLWILSIIAICAIAIVLRFINYDNRFGLGSDQAGFAIVSTYALDSRQFPLLGPFSSSGPFQTGGEWYWLMMLGMIFIPGGAISPWIFMGILSVLFVIGMIWVGTSIGGKKLGLIAGFISALSTAQMTQSTNLSNQTPIGLFALLALASALQYLQTKKLRYLFLLGLMINTASAIHLQGIALFPLIVAVFVVTGLPSLAALCTVILGLIVPWLPVFWADSHNNFTNTKNMIYYYRIDQYRISLDVMGRNWRTFVSQFIPHIWSFTIGGYRWTGYITVPLTALVFCYLGIKQKLTRPWLFIILSFIGMLAITRYTHVPLYESFVVFLHPYILLLTSGAILWIMQKNTIMGFMCIMLLAIPTMVKNNEEITRSTNLTAKEAKRYRSVLTRLYPGQSFALYDYRYRTNSKSLPLVMYLGEQSRVSPSGKRIGIAQPTEEEHIPHPVIYTDSTGAKLYDLEASTSAQLIQDHWADISPKAVYDSVQNWYKSPATPL